MAPQRILFADHAQAIGGAEQSLLLLLEFLDRERFLPLLACPPGRLAEKAIGLGVEVCPLSFPRLRRSARFPLDLALGARHLASLVRQRGAAILVANTVRAALYAAPAARLARKPLLWYMRDFWMSETRPRSPVFDRVGKQMLTRSASRVIANSQAVAAALPSRSKVTLVHNGVDVSLFAADLDSSAFRGEFNIPADAPVIGMVGRLRPWKGQDRFLQAAALVARDHPATRFLIVGGTPFGPEDGYPERMERLAEELGLADQVVFTGQLEDVRPALAAMDVFVHPGDPEPFGLVNLEAMAMGLPVVGFAHGALPEIVVEHETGLLVPPGDTPGLARAIGTLLLDSDRRHKMGMLGRERVERTFTIQNTVREVTDVLEEIVANQRI